MSSKHASCDENKDNIDSQMSIVDFPTELLVGERGQSAESLEVKNDKSSNATNFEQLKLNNKNEVDSKTNTESKKSNDIIIGVEEKTSCKYVTDEKKSQVKSDEDDGRIGDEEEEKKIGTGTSCMYFNEMCIVSVFFSLFTLYIKNYNNLYHSIKKICMHNNINYCIMHYL